jgi:hypothetical protein
VRREAHPLVRATPGAPDGAVVLALLGREVALDAIAAASVLLRSTAQLLGFAEGATRGLLGLALGAGGLLGQSVRAMAGPPVGRAGSPAAAEAVSAPLSSVAHRVASRAREAPNAPRTGKRFGGSGSCRAVHAFV